MSTLPSRFISYFIKIVEYELKNKFPGFCITAQHKKKKEENLHNIQILPQEMRKIEEKENGADLKLTLKSNHFGWSDKSLLIQAKKKNLIDKKLITQCEKMSNDEITPSTSSFVILYVENCIKLYYASSLIHRFSEFTENKKTDRKISSLPDPIEPYIFFNQFLECRLGNTKKLTFEAKSELEIKITNDYSVQFS